MLTREEVMSKVISYFKSCVKVVLDEDTQEKVTTWVRNPTKSGLALCLGIDKQTLLDLENTKFIALNFPLKFPLCYIFPQVITNPDKGKNEGKPKNSFIL